LKSNSEAVVDLVFSVLISILKITEDYYKVIYWKSFWLFQWSMVSQRTLRIFIGVERFCRSII